jgi:putative spermidine/putrescine transport system substrate-binding protein
MGGEKMEKSSKLLFNWLVTCFTAVTLIVAFFCSFRDAFAAPNELVIQGWGGAKTEAEKKAFFDTFTKETGIKIVSVDAGGDMWGKVAAQVKSKNIEWDIVSGQDYPSVEAAAAKGLLEKLDYNKIPAAKELIPGSVKEYGMGQEINSVCIAYNYKKFAGDNYPKSWADFFDTNKFPGPRAMNNFGAPAVNLMIALLAEGVAPDKLIPIDIDRAFKKLDQIKPHVKLWFTSGSQLTQGLLNEEIVLATAWDGRAKVAMNLGAPVRLEFNQGLFFICYWNIVKGTPNLELAYKFFNHICKAELQAIYTQGIGYSSANPKSVEFLPAEVKKYQAVLPENLKKQIVIMAPDDLEWLSKNDGIINEKWNAWVSK